MIWFYGAIHTLLLRILTTSRHSTLVFKPTLTEFPAKSTIKTNSDIVSSPSVMSSPIPSPPTPSSLSTPGITIEWSIARVDGVKDDARLPLNGSTVFPLQPAQPLSSSTENESSPSPLSSTTAPPPPRVYNQSNSAHYTSLLSSLSQAKDTLNTRLTEWKDVIGDKEKHKEVLPPGTAGKQGMGKAMMMVQAAKQVDGRAKEGEKEEAVVVGAAGREKGSVGLPTDDQESDEDDDVELVVAE